MTTKYNPPSVEPTYEDSSSEDERKGVMRFQEEDSPDESSHRHFRSSHEPGMSPANANIGRERTRKAHKSGRHTSKSKSKNTGVKRASMITARENVSDGLRLRHNRTLSGRSASSTNSSSDEDEPVPDHREVLAAAKARLTSPSMISTLTTLTTSTKKSSSSSGSNSTVTQASITKPSTLGKRPEVAEAPLSPAVPDPPNVFAFLDEDASPEGELENFHYHQGEERVEHSGGKQVHEEGLEPVAEEENEEEDNAGEGPSRWPSYQTDNAYGETSGGSTHAPPSTSTSSASSSFHGDDSIFEPHVDNDTDRSTSPEGSAKEQDEAHKASAHTDPASAKLASQIAAARQRQNLYGSMPQYGTPNMPRGNTPLPHLPSSALSQRHQQLMGQRALPRAEKLPVTGYELLASRLSSADNARIKPMYRKFEALNHRLLLHLQDELSELEEQLHRLDNADTQSRRTDKSIIPASRRAAAQAGGELQWHKTDVLGRIGYKLNQYNQALSSFNSTQSLAPPAPDDISNYRHYLQTERPIADIETHFLDPADDLVSICSESLQPLSQFSHAPPSSTSSSSEVSHESSSQLQPEFDEEEEEEEDDNKSPLPGLAMAIAVSVLVPIMTFHVIPGFVGRMTVSFLVALGVFGALVQSGIIRSGVLLVKEGAMCAAIYGCVMSIVAGTMA